MFFSRHPKEFASPPTMGFDPQGMPLHELGQLPASLSLHAVIIGKSGISLDGWVLPYGHLTKGSLLWLRRNLKARIEAHPEDREWAEDIVDTMMDRFTGKF